MPRAIWSGAISFGLVNVPVKLYSAVSRKTVRFHQLNADTQARIQQKRVDAETGEEVPYERIVKGYEISPDRYVVIEPAELEGLDPDKTRTIDMGFEIVQGPRVYIEKINISGNTRTLDRIIRRQFPSRAVLPEKRH